jgi:hypothetical protein
LFIFYKKSRFLDETVGCEHKWLDSLFLKSFASSLVKREELNESAKKGFKRPRFEKKKEQGAMTFISEISIFSDVISISSEPVMKEELRVKGRMISHQLKHPQNIFNRIIEKFENSFYLYFKSMDEDNLNINQRSIIHGNFLPKEYADYSEITKNAITQVLEFVRILLNSVIYYYNQMFEIRILNEIKEYLENHLLDIVVKNKVYSIFNNLFHMENKTEEKIFSDKLREFAHLTPEDLGVNRFLCLTKNSKLGEYFYEGEGKAEYVFPQQRRHTKSIPSRKNIISSEVKEIKNLKFLSGYHFENRETAYPINLSFGPDDLLKPNTSREEEFKINELPNPSSLQNLQNNPNLQNFQNLKDLHKHRSSNPLSLKKIRTRLLCPPYTAAIKKLREISTSESPTQKLKCIGTLNDTICECVDQFWEGIDVDREDVFIDADQLLSIFIYVILHSRICDLFSSLSFVNEFTTHSTKAHLVGYNLASIQACLYHILTMDKSQVMSSSKNINAKSIINFQKIKFSFCEKSIFPGDFFTNDDDQEIVSNYFRNERQSF